MLIMGLTMFGSFALVCLGIVFIDWSNKFITKYKQIKFESQFNIGDRFYKINRVWGDPFNETDSDIISVEILDKKKNYNGETYIKFRYLTKTKLVDHKDCPHDKVKTIYSMKLNKFAENFTNRMKDE